MGTEGQLRRTLYALAIAIAVPCGSAAAGVDEERRAVAEPGAVRSEGAPVWDDRHMRSRFPSRREGRSSPRLIVPEGSEDNPIPKARTIYSSPDRNWKSGNGRRSARTRSSTRSGDGGFSLGTSSTRVGSPRSPIGSVRARSTLRSASGHSRGRR